MPAQRKRKRKVLRAQKSSRGSKKYVWVVLLLLLGLIWGINSFVNSVWDGKNKLAIVSASDDSTSIRIVVLDPQNEQLTSVDIPGNTLVDVSGGRGEWKLKSVWTLGAKDNIAGEILSGTITKNFKFPTSSWWESTKFDSDSSFSLIRSVFTPGETNLSFVDRVKVVNYILKSDNNSRSEINLAKTNYIDETTLADGESGYKITGSIPKNLLVVFSNDLYSNRSVTVEIVDATGEYGVSDNLGEVIQAMGGKVVSVKEISVEDIDCEIKAKDKEVGEVLTHIVGCELERIDSSNIDIEVTIGKEFAERY